MALIQKYLEYFSLILLRKTKLFPTEKEAFKLSSENVHNIYNIAAVAVFSNSDLSSGNIFFK